MKVSFITPEMYSGPNHYQDLKDSKHRSVFESKKGNLKIMCLESAQYIGQDIIDAYNDFLKSNDSLDEIVLTQSKTNWFKDREVRVDVMENIDGSDVYILSSPFNPKRFYSNDPKEIKSINDYTMELLNGIEVVTKFGGRAVPVMLYFPYGRQDKPDYQERQSSGAKLLANLIETAGAKHLIGFNFHAEQIKGYFSIPVDEIDMSIVFTNYLEKYHGRKDVMVIGPDTGSLKWIRRVARTLELRYSSADKVRPAPNVAQVDDINADFRGIKTVILLDDMWDTFGTGQGAIEFLVNNTKVKEVVLAAYFPLMNDPAPKRIMELIDKGIVTDLVSMPTVEQRDAVRQINLYRELPIAETIALLINRRHYSSSIKSIFSDFKGPKK
ncbi:MAG: hypothetical protein DRJ64_06400 [Thermoprotei archaeon]|nr:MAG: hypothetical protein DRJ64_06400 [Thermoprotei archaeon]